MQSKKEYITKVQVQALDTFGKDKQMIVAIEELSELQKELCKSLRGLNKRTQILEELADVMFMLPQVCAAYDITEDEIIKVQQAKAERLQGLLEGLK